MDERGLSSKQETFRLAPSIAAVNCTMAGDNLRLLFMMTYIKPKMLSSSTTWSFPAAIWKVLCGGKGEGRVNMSKNVTSLALLCIFVNHNPSPVEFEPFARPDHSLKVGYQSQALSFATVVSSLVLLIQTIR